LGIGCCPSRLKIGTVQWTDDYKDILALHQKLEVLVIDPGDRRIPFYVKLKNCEEAGPPDQGRKAHAAVFIWERARWRNQTKCVYFACCVLILTP
jgi:hypothetical protein